MNGFWRKAAVAALSIFSISAKSAVGMAEDPRGCVPSPALDIDFPDPSISYSASPTDPVFAYGTNIAAPTHSSVLNVPVIQSSDLGLTQWSSPIDALPHLPAWARAGFTWAPAIVRGEGAYRLYFTARYGFSGRPCIGVAVSKTPQGPFIPTDDAKPMVCPLAEGGAIDPSVFRDDDGKEYLLWKTDTNCCDGDPTIYIQQLTPDGLALAGGPVSDAPWVLPYAKALIHRDRLWEGRVIEAPTLLKHDGRYYLFYSGGDYALRDYAIGYAASSSLFGPYLKADDPILSAVTSGLVGPGGQDVFAGPHDDFKIAFHAWREASAKRYRALYFGQIEWRGGAPSVALTCPSPPADAARR